MKKNISNSINTNILFFLYSKCPFFLNSLTFPFDMLVKHYVNIELLKSFAVCCIVSSINCLSDFFALFFLHLFCFIPLVTMPILDLFNNFTSKYSQVFSSFLQAYSDIRQMKNINNSLIIISQCIFDEHSQGSSKCLNYYIAHDMDKVILQLNEQINLEPFYCSILPLVAESYLNSEFFTEAWKYKKFFKLAAMYAEKCVILRKYDPSFAESLIETFPKSKSSIILLCEFDKYLSHFSRSDIVTIAIDHIALLIRKRSYEAVELIEFLVFFEDKSSVELLSKINFTNSNNSNVNNDIPTEINREKSVIKDSYSSEFGYFFMIFKQIKSIKIRHKILEFIPMIVENSVSGIDECVEFLLECIKIDCVSVCAVVNQYEPIVWCPLTVFNLIKKNYKRIEATSIKEESTLSLTTEVSGNCTEENTIILESPSDPRADKLFIIFNKIMRDDKLASNCHKMRLNSVKANKKSKIYEILITKCNDPRIFSFLLFLNDTLILNNLDNILDGIKDKTDFCHLLFTYLS